jgi:prepilin-type N-terminal cleavage/methylation domain-containing protein/prepilin-type processing-associated H-X9-DG protein
VPRGSLRDKKEKIMIRKHAFTLIELLMVVAIIGILLSIMFPFIGILRDSALSVRCTSALRQIGMGCVYYSQHTRGYVPDAYTKIDGVAWNQLIDSYLDTEAATFKDTSKLMWECPMWKRRPSVQIYNSDPNSDYWRVFGFGMNPRLQLQTRELNGPVPENKPDPRYFSNDRWYDMMPKSYRFDSISFRSNRVLIGDSTNNRIYTQAPALIWPNINGIPDHDDPARHHGRANYLFCDLHASSLTPEQGILAVGDPEYLP